MKTVEIKLGVRTYPIYIGISLTHVGDYIKDKNITGKVLVITNTTVNKLYGDMVVDSITRSGFDVSITKIPDGEEYKTLDTVNGLYQVCMDNHLDRNSLIVALGGGVVGDIAGFVAATFMRGVPFMQVPTTLLSQVDSSIGGKVGVNHPESKNMIGAFYQPIMVFIDISTLKTLPEREFNSGLAEAIKYGIIRDKKYFTVLERDMTKIKALNIERVEYTVWRSCQIKKWVVELDEQETKGLRAILNYGHTIGHAIEAATNYKTYLHGEAVSIGMVCIAKIAKELKLLNSMWTHRIERILTRAELPITHKVSTNKIIEKLIFDKKVLNGKVRFVLTDGRPGRTVIKDDVPEALIRKVLEEQKV
ncbi:MAG: 3-dehydroquinate synthase [Elusimicrobia bacterium RIFOXYC2_FULL_34_12]|nr:MAG: 3-dehydroquinate synthase [Elusimicrobia bacterium RIFOXYC2_FULL_34_12]OGS39281.1 MAG: 3-dehydroquinate synthase [Elusimicrobia bacterium RIFOXYD2_FULL_34_30]HAM38810.1 3-dehydroquinate synthase [Elusimicrobiota bacterium]